MPHHDTHEVHTLFRQRFQQTPAHVIQAPGRLELLGNHTDYNDGLVMSLAVDKYIFMAASPRTDGRVELVSSAFSGAETFSIDVLEKSASAPWTNYVKGVLEQFRKRGVHYSGFNAAVHGTIPMGAGMSSSAALEVATALMVRQLNPFTLTGGNPPERDSRGHVPPPSHAERLELARLCRAAENEFVGVKCGILDQISSLFGKAGHAIEIDCQSLKVGHAPLSGAAVIVCNSAVKHELVGGEYNELRENCESAARKLGARALRTVDLKEVEAGRDRLTQREYECARHVVSEIARVVAGESALRGNDLGQFGQYMFQSHFSSRDFLRNSTRELDVLVDLAGKHPGCLGARLTGGGFGGATINLVAHHQAESFMDHMKRGYQEALGIGIVPLVCQIADGAE